MSSDPVKLVRVPVNTRCADPNCKKELPFGSYAYWNKDSEIAICCDCGVKRGWSSKDRASDIIKKLELQEDIKALKKQRKIEADGLLLLKQEIDLHRLGERELELDTKITSLSDLLDEYLKKCGTPEEKELFHEVVKELEGTLNLRKEVREHIESHLFLLERTKLKRKQRGMMPFMTEEEQEQQ